MNPPSQDRDWLEDQLSDLETRYKELKEIRNRDLGEDQKAEVETEMSQCREDFRRYDYDLKKIMTRDGGYDDGSLGMDVIKESNQWRIDNEKYNAELETKETEILELQDSLEQQATELENIKETSRSLFHDLQVEEGKVKGLGELNEQAENLVRVLEVEVEIVQLQKRTKKEALIKWAIFSFSATTLCSLGVVIALITQYYKDPINSLPPDEVERRAEEIVSRATLYFVDGQYVRFFVYDAPTVMGFLLRVWDRLGF